MCLEIIGLWGQMNGENAMRVCDLILGNSENATKRKQIIIIKSIGRLLMTSGMLSYTHIFMQLVMI